MGGAATDEELERMVSDTRTEKEIRAQHVKLPRRRREKASES